MTDSIIWKGAKNGIYSANQYCKNVLCYNGYQGKDFWKSIWAGLVPPKVEIFCWQMIRGRIAVREQLARRGLLNWDAAVCALCKSKVETVGHLFFSCKLSWLIWMYCCSIWDVSWVIHNNPEVVLMAWQCALPRNRCSKAWKMAFFAIVWSIWLMRNDMVFNNKGFDLRQMVDNIKFRIASWFKAKWPRSNESISELIRYPNLISVPLRVKPVRVVTMWIPPSRGYMKFNVDGSAKSKPGPAGIGGVLRDNLSVVKMIFSKSVGIEDSNMAELLAVREAMRDRKSVV